MALPLAILSSLLAFVGGHHLGHYVMEHPQTFVHHHVEPVQYVYPVNSASVQPSAGASASCTLAPSSAEGLVRGLVTLHQHHPGAPVLVSGSVEGLIPGLHGFHLHRDGSTADACKAAGPHFNPTNATHGSPNDESRHAGDFGNIEADVSGQAVVSFATRGISLAPAGAADSVVGRAFVVHAKADDLGRGSDAESRKTGNAGARVACCVVALH
ncbi:superoxide dismutase [Cu-Zn]-like [Neocloeon triangulifer]|uniref:superoxide dismutase [Cu-Zn]-like n=1 Tax=Neocloeon triangulifer TaxID=2078957 RepID=UPI00286EF78A|nr:superoxide dismutase [Cu-Zn]-like [Neocloeon triangulifer]